MCSIFVYIICLVKVICTSDVLCFKLSPGTFKTNHDDEEGGNHEDYA